MIKFTEKIYQASSETETEQVAKEFANTLKGGEIIYYHGDLGAGKTFFTRAMCEALGFTGYVNSPSYIILNEYKTKEFDIYHYDLYRTATTDELTEIGFYEYPGKPNTITFVEWAELLLEEDFDCSVRYKVIINVISATQREIKIRKYE